MSEVHRLPYRPAYEPSVRQTDVLGWPARLLRDAIARLREYRVRRNTLQKLTEMDDHMLRDIGIGRDELGLAARLPLEMSAHRQLSSFQAARRDGPRSA